MRVTVLGSGSRGNAILVEAGDERVLVDAGFSGRDLARRMAAVDVDADTVTGIVVTHDHGDHTRGVGVYARRHRTPIHMTRPTRAACDGLLSGDEVVRFYDAATPFDLGPLRIRPFLTVHDAVDPVAVTVTDTRTGSRLGVATDLGRPTTSVRAALAGSHLLVLEANHDHARLWNGPYPWSVKQRIASSRGHLSNHASAELAAELFHPDLAGVVLAHLSDSCNDPGLAHAVVGRALDRLGYGGRLEVAAQDEPGEPIDVESLRQAGTTRQLSLF